MRILLVNDDGYRSDGINALGEVLEEAGHDVSIIAPKSEQSGKSHSMSILGTCWAESYAENRWHMTGSPADCVIFGLGSGIIGTRPDLVISGINHGYNLSSDIIYSGTCAAARQATLYGIKAIAVSKYTSERHPASYEDYLTVARFLLSHLDEWTNEIGPYDFLNINVPHNFNGKARLASIGEIRYIDSFHVTTESDGRTRIDNTGCKIDFRRVGDGRHPNDFNVVKEGYASLTFVDILPSSIRQGDTFGR